MLFILPDLPLQITQRLMYFVKSPLKIARWCPPNYFEAWHYGLYPCMIMELTSVWSLSKMFKIPIICVCTWFLLAFFLKVWYSVEIIVMKVKRISNFLIKWEKFLCSIQIWIQAPCLTWLAQNYSRHQNRCLELSVAMPGTKLKWNGQSCQIHSLSFNNGDMIILLLFY